MSAEPRLRASRRIVFHGLGAVGVAIALAGCGGGDDPTADDSPAPSPSESDEPTSEPTSEPSSLEATESQSEPPPEEPAALATTEEVPVGGGLILTDERIVITQPEAGQFAAFSAVCKHQGETVGEVEDGTITCTFHGSQYDAATGAVTNGPATSGLDPIEITVRKGEIRLA